jgi:Na+-transporting methylmalonyl-CoA/oxaloacetate decarboxylase beta subunit
VRENRTQGSARGLSSNRQLYLDVKMMIRKIVLIANIIALIIFVSPAIFISFFMIKHRDVASIGIIGGGDGPTAIFYSFKFDPTNIIPWFFMIILLCLNIYVIKKCTKKEK